MWPTGGMRPLTCGGRATGTLRHIEASATALLNRFATCLHSQQHPTAGRRSLSSRLDRVRKEQDVQRKSTAADAPAEQRRRKPDEVSLAVKVQRKGFLEEPLLPGDCAMLRCGNGAVAALADLCWLPAASRLAQVPVVQQSRLMLLWRGAGAVLTSPGQLLQPCRPNRGWLSDAELT